MRVFMILILLFSGLFFTTKNHEQNYLLDSEILAQFFIEYNYEITNVEIVIHSYITKDQYELFEQYVNNPHREHSLVETYSGHFVNENKVKLVYKIKANEWKESTQNEISHIFSNDKLHQILQNSKVYSCFQSEINGNIDSNKVIDQIVDYFKIKVKNSMEETGFKVKSGTTKFFDQYIPSNNGDINIQFALRDQALTKKVVTVGTPILVNEY